MKITIEVATTKDGFINHLGQKHASDWTSAADKKRFAAALSEHSLLLMGRATYEANKDHMKHDDTHRRIVFTRTPQNYESLPGVLEFTNEPLAVALKRLERDGFKRGLLLGGGVLYTAFLEAELVDEVYQTVEPLEFGEGVPFLTNGYTLKDFTYLTLLTSESISDAGTLLLHYKRK